jgi:thiol-disulfide isomerase/thioredoxin
MTRIFKTFLLVGLISVLATTALAAPAIIQGPVDFGNYRGKWVVLNYWATWCNICLEEVPELNAFYNVHRNQVVMLGVNYDDGSLAGLPQRVKESGIVFPVLAYDPKNQFGVSRIRGLPTTILIDPNGQVKRVLLGSHTKRELEEEIGL